MAINNTTKYITNPNTIPIDSSTGNDELPSALDKRGIRVSSVVQIRTSSFGDDLTQIWLAGESGEGTGKGGVFYKDSTDTTSQDNGLTIIVDSDGSRWKRSMIDSSNISVDVNLSERRIPINETDHKAFGLTDNYNLNVIHCYRSATKHENESDTAIKVVVSDNDGRSWSTSQIVFTETGRDVGKNIAGGFTSSGRFFIAFQAKGISGFTGDTNKIYVTYTDDLGASWSSVVTIYSSDTVELAPYGKLVQIGSKIIIGGYILPTSNQEFHVWESTDDAATWTQTQVFGPADFGSTSFHLSETALVYAGNDVIIGVSRNGTTPPVMDDGNRPLLFMSLDAGVSWTGPSTADGPDPIPFSVVGASGTATDQYVHMGKNPPVLWHNSDTGTVVLIYPTRDTDVPESGFGKFWPFYYSFSTVSEIVNQGAAADYPRWRMQSPLPIYTPSNPENGDGGYPHIINTSRGREMVFYRGNHVGVTDYYIANVEKYLGGI